jgi:hypothetical protein
MQAARFVLAIGLLTATAAASAQNYVADRLTRLTNEMSSKGWTQMHGDMTGSLRKDTRVEYTIWLIRGAQYYIRGFCDVDCKDLDLYVFDAAGNQIAKDTDVDDIPIISLTAPQSGRFTLRVVMEQCSVEPCGYGVRMYAPR